MNNKLKRYFKELEKYGDLSDPDNDMAFMEVVDKIVETNDPEVIPFLLDLLDDNMDGDYTFETLPLRIEYFDDNDYIPCLLRKVKDVIKKAFYECGYLFYAIFNKPESLKILKKNIHLADKESLLKVLNYLENDDCPEQDKPIIAELRYMIEHPNPENQEDLESPLIQGELF